MMKRWFEDWDLNLFEIVGILGIIVLLLTQVSVMGIPLSQLAGIGALYIALAGALRRLTNQKYREHQREEKHEQEQGEGEEQREMEWRDRVRAEVIGLPLEEFDSQTVIYNVYGENAYIDTKPERRERSDRALDHTPVGERAARNRNLDEFESERGGPHRREDEDEQTQRDTTRFVHGVESEEEREREFEMDCE